MKGWLIAAMGVVVGAVVLLMNKQNNSSATAGGGSAAGSSATGPLSPASVAQLVIATANQVGIDPNLALQVATAESSLNENALSPTGAIGVMQLEPLTAAGLGVDPNDVSQNILGGVTYLKQLLSQFGGDVSAALAAYNWGPGNVARAMENSGAEWITEIPTETSNYLNRILGALGVQQ